MSGRFYRGRRYSRARSYKSYPKRSSLIRRSMGNMKAAKRQNDLSNTTLSGSSLAYIIPVAANRDYGYNSFNVWNALNDSPMFRTLSQCYDQIRINNVKVKFSLLAAATMTGSNCPVFATVWDRNGFHIDQYKLGTTDFMKGSNLSWDWERFASYSSFEKDLCQVVLHLMLLLVFILLVWLRNLCIFLLWIFLNQRILEMILQKFVLL